MPAPKASSPARKPPDAARVRELFEGLADLLLRDTDAARAVLADTFEPFQLRPLVGADGSRGYHLELPLKSMWEEKLRGRDLPNSFGYG
jgi:hypothetical protein